jgi:hypothetical protein
LFEVADLAGQTVNVLDALVRVEAADWSARRYVVCEPQQLHAMAAFLRGAHEAFEGEFAFDCFEEDFHLELRFRQGRLLEFSGWIATDHFAGRDGGSRAAVLTLPRVNTRLRQCKRKGARLPGRPWR